MNWPERLRAAAGAMALGNGPAGAAVPAIPGNARPRHAATIQQTGMNRRDTGIGQRYFAGVPPLGFAAGAGVGAAAGAAAGFESPPDFAPESPDAFAGEPESAFAAAL